MTNQRIATLAVIAIGCLAGLRANAIDTSHPRVKTIVIVATSPLAEYPVDRTIVKSLPGFLKEELTTAGFEAKLLDKTIKQLQKSPDTVGNYDILLEIGYSRADGESQGGVAAGVPIGDVGIGGEMSVVSAHAVAEIIVYNAKTLEPLDRMKFEGNATSPALTGVNFGDAHGFVFFRIPIRPSGPFREAARQIAKEAAKEIGAQFGEVKPAPEPVTK